MENLADEFDQRLTALWHVLGRRGKRELSRTAASVLATLRDTGPRRITELAESEGVAQPTVTTLVGGSSATGYVERRAGSRRRARRARAPHAATGLERLDAMRAAREARARDAARRRSPNASARYSPPPCPCWTS